MKHEKTEPAFRLGGMVISDRITADLLNALRTGNLSACDRLPAEVELAEAMGVSRTVIRDALSELEREGYIERVRGIGTVVNRNVLSLQSRLDQKLEYSTLIRSLGSQPRVDALQVTLKPADAALASSLGIQTGDPLVCIQKQILADNRPVIHSIDYLPKALFGTEDLNRLDLSQSIFDILEQRCGQQPATTVAHIRASCGTPAIRNAMHLVEDEALLLLDEICYNRLCKPILHAYSYYTNFFDFSILRKML